MLLLMLSHARRAIPFDTERRRRCFYISCDFERGSGATCSVSTGFSSFGAISPFVRVNMASIGDTVPAVPSSSSLVVDNPYPQEWGHTANLGQCILSRSVHEVDADNLWRASANSLAFRSSGCVGLFAMSSVVHARWMLNVRLCACTCAGI